MNAQPPRRVVIRGDGIEHDNRARSADGEVEAFERYLQLDAEQRSAQHWQEWEASLISGAADALKADVRTRSVT